MLTVNEAAELILVHPEELKEAIKDGSLRAEKIKGRWMVRKSELLKWLEN
ncbi:hypothetical protein DCCM_2462 [Desulfocucumis palustris]|uniref:Helix-turn-helix domain-containing protein n=2 Tax=Desulfocucumis palustris TaxID=1898651 RepID=A0A2L2XHK9_9FIRM|nr:hypothetical protein DCCM_2462 [Desulfocucumis palustris]